MNVQLPVGQRQEIVGYALQNAVGRRPPTLEDALTEVADQFQLLICSYVPINPDKRTVVEAMVDPTQLPPEEQGIISDQTIATFFNDLVQGNKIDLTVEWV